MTGNRRWAGAGSCAVAGQGMSERVEEGWSLVERRGGVGWDERGVAKPCRSIGRDDVYEREEI